MTELSVSAKGRFSPLKKSVWLSATSIALIFTPLVYAHHAATVTYDTDQIIEIEGEITRLIWRNPHVRFTLDVTNGDNETVKWNVESIPVTRLTRVGVSPNLVAIGQTVRVAGFPSRRTNTDVYAVNLLLEDQREILLDTPVARWSDDTIGTGRDETPGALSADPSLGIFRVWSTDGNMLALGSMGDNPSFRLTERAKQDLAAWDPLSLENPFRGCAPKGMPIIMEQPNPMEFIDQGDRVLIRMEEYDTVRTIHMNDSLDQDTESSILGHSVGRWEAGTLMIHTSRINWRYFNQRGLMQSNAIEIDERFTPSEDGSRLDYEISATDPSTFIEPAVITKTWLWVPGDEVLPFDCTEG